MKNYRSLNVLPLIASVALIVSGCSVSDPSVSPPGPDDTPVVETSDVPSADKKESDESPSCDDPDVECDDYGNILGENESVEGDPQSSDPAANSDEGSETSENDESSDNKESASKNKEFTPYDKNCVSTYPVEDSSYASFALTPVDENYIPEGGVDHSYTIESLDGEVYFKCETNMGAIRTFGLPSFVKEPVRAYGVMDGKEFDIVFDVNDYGTGSNDREVEYYQVLFFRSDPSEELIISEGFPWDSHHVILENNIT